MSAFDDLRCLRVSVPSATEIVGLGIPGDTVRTLCTATHYGDTHVHILLSGLSL